MHALVHRRGHSRVGDSRGTKHLAKLLVKRADQRRRYFVNSAGSTCNTVEIT